MGVLKLYQARDTTYWTQQTEEAVQCLHVDPTRERCQEKDVQHCVAPPNCRLPIQGSRTSRQKTLDYHGFHLSFVRSVDVAYSNYTLPALLLSHLDMPPIHLLIH